MAAINSSTVRTLAGTGARVVGRNWQLPAIALAGAGVGVALPLGIRAASGNDHGWQTAGWAAAGAAALTTVGLTIAARKVASPQLERALGRAAAVGYGATLGATLTTGIAGGDFSRLRRETVAEFLAPTAVGLAISSGFMVLGGHMHIERTARTAMILAKDTRIPKVVRGGMALSMVPFPGHDLVRASAGGYMLLRHRPVLQEAWAAAKRPQVAKAAAEAAGSIVRSA